MMCNPNFKVVEFDHFKIQSGLPTFVLSAKQWIEKTDRVARLCRWSWPIECSIVWLYRETMAKREHRPCKEK